MESIVPSKRAAIIDTNIWITLSMVPAYLPKILLLRQLCKDKGVHLAVPEVLVEEFKRHRGETKEKFLRQVRSAAGLAGRFGAQLDATGVKKLESLDAAISEALKEVLGRAEPRNLEEVEKLLTEPTCCKQSDEKFAAAAKRAFHKQAPSHNKPSIGDCILWDCVTAHLDRYQVFFCSENTRDFAGEDGKTLHPDLAKEAGALKNPLQYFVNLDDLLKALAPLEAPAGPAYVVGIGGPPYDFDKPTSCPECGQKESFAGGAYLLSRYGGLTRQYFCTKCGYRHDTGDSFDC